MEKKSQRKSQTSIEFMILLAFVLFFFVLFFLAIQEINADKIKERKNLRIKEIALSVQDEINLALETSDGYYREFEIPEKIEEQEYDINIVEDMVYIKTQDAKYAIALPVAEVAGQIVKGQNYIRKENGIVYLNE